MRHVPPRQRPARAPAPTRPELLSWADAIARVPELGQFQGSYRSVLLFDGDVALDGDFLEAIGRVHPKRDYAIIAVNGDLAVTGRIALYESYPGLLVTGSTTAETLEGGDCEIYVGNGRIAYFVFGYYNDGILDAGHIATPWVINSDHDLRIDAPKAYTVDLYDEDADVDFTSQNIAASFVPQVLDDDGEGIDIRKLYRRLARGKRILKKGAKTATEAALASIVAARDARATRLDLTDKKLKSFPSTILEMPWLVELILDGNAIAKLPDEIGTLAELEVLSLENCDLVTLPASIGKLAKLRVLRVPNNSTVAWNAGAEDFEHTVLALPDAIGDLAALEELDVSELSHGVDSDDEDDDDDDGPATWDDLAEMTTFSLPASIARCTRLRKIVANYTNIVFPEAMWGMASIEELHLSGGSSAYLKAFPWGLASFHNLRVLDVSDNFFRTIPELGGLANLEELNLDNALGFVDELPDLSRLSKLRVLKLAGNTNRTDVREPGHAVLAQLFRMNLPALEELGIDRWGEEEEDDEVYRPGVPAEVLRGIGRFTALKKLDLSFCDLVRVPDDLLALPALADLDVHYNKLPAAERKRIAEAYPKARVDFRNQDVEEDEEATGDAARANELIKQANRHRDNGDYDRALAAYGAALELLEGGAVSNAYQQLYARYGRMWIHGKRGYGSDGSDAERAAWRRAGVEEAEACLQLVPPVWMIWHFTDEGQFHREVVRYATNLLAWELYKNGGDLARALELIERGVACADDEHDYVRDTQVRVLLALGREAEAWRVVHHVLHRHPDFADLADLAKDPRYLAWSRSSSP